MPDLTDLLNKVHNLDCFDLLRCIPDDTIDAIITDLPYGTTACSWDTVIPFAPMWTEVKRVLKPRGVFVTTTSQPFTSALVMSNPAWFKYSWVWDKKYHSNPFLSNKQPLRKTEDILVFSEGDATYYPQMIKRPNEWRRSKPSYAHKNGKIFGKSGKAHPNSSMREWMFPHNLISIPLDNPYARDTTHPTQKPVALYEYLIKTYTQPDELVLDFCAGSGTTPLACRNTGRRFIAGDSDATYCAIARDRLRLPFEPRQHVKESAPLSDLPLFAATGD